MAPSYSINIKRVYEPVEPDDGIRILVERLWPRGLSKEKAQVEYWCKEVAPSHELRKWYGHQVERWPVFREKYIQELKQNPDAVTELQHYCLDKKVTFVYAARDEAHNSSVVLKEFLESL
jgi:uncharacterized protein YeaO (DUF488 family)